MTQKPYRFPDPAEYGTRRAVTAQECPTCHERYIALQQPIFITDDLGQLIMTYKVGQLICHWCLKRNAEKLHVQVHLA